MQSDNDHLLEEDWLDQAPEPSAPAAQPMVVIHYRNRGVPLWVLIPLIILVPIGGILVYHRFFMEADRADAVEARQTPRDGIAVKRIEARAPSTVGSQPVESTSNSKSVATVAPPSPSPASPTSKPSTLPAPSPTDAVAGRTGAAAKTAGLTQPNPKASVAGNASPVADSAARPPQTVIAGEADRSPAKPTLVDPVAAVKKTTASPAVAAGPAAKGSVAVNAPDNRSTPAKNKSEIPVAHEPPADGAGRLAVASESVPDVFKQERVRLIQRAEAAKKQAEIESHAYEERRKFREELKDVLASNANRSGPEIDKLSRRNSQDRDPEKYAQARQAWFFTRMSPPAKVRLIRSLGLPESVILDFISAELHPHIGARGGPRDTNDVRVRAAKLLLSYELPAPASMVAAARAPGPPDESKPSEKAPARGPSGGTWAFRPGRDTFRANALLDLRGLNEKVAGQSGFVRLSADGESFVAGDGAPIRFWGVSTDTRNDLIVDESAHHARFLAKRGVNMIRWYRPYYSKAKNSRITDSDPKSIEATWRFIAAMKKEGIYTTLCPYWCSDIKPAPTWRGLDGWGAKDIPWGLLFFNPSLQQAYKAWLKALLTRPNPYTGVSLANDPAIAVIQLQNEDSLLFFTSQQIKGKQAELLGHQFGDWLKTKYGTLDDAFRAWANDKAKEDKPAQGIVSLLFAWEWTQPREGGRKKRLDDQLQFFTETMFGFNREIERYLHEDLGCKQLVNANNWRSVDAIKVGDAERWSYTANEVLAVNRYYSLTHNGPEGGWRINSGDTFEDVSALFRPRDVPLNIKQADGHPMMITECHWVPPLSYQSEGPFLVAAYQSLNGVDVLDWSATSEPEWSDQDRSAWDSASRAKYQIATPMVLGQFPAAALLFRKGYLKQGQPVVEEHRSLRQIWERVPTIIAEDPGYDPNRDMGGAPNRPGQSGPVDPLAFLVGPVKVNYDSDPAKTKVADLGKFIDHDRKVVRANTGQVSLDYGRGLCTIDAPRAQGACGFLKNAGPVELSSVTLRSENDYASVLIVSMDGEILSKSTRVLVQVGTRARPTDWVERETTFTAGKDKHTVTGKRIVSTGRMPWAIENTNVTLEVKNPGLRKATSLDLNGNSRVSWKVADAGGSFRVDLPHDAMYVILDSE